MSVPGELLKRFRSTTCEPVPTFLALGSVKQEKWLGANKAENSFQTPHEHKVEGA
jgi:hypothetical protein